MNISFSLVYAVIAPPLSLFAAKNGGQLLQAYGGKVTIA
jgi:hypothetical protein